MRPQLPQLKPFFPSASVSVPGQTTTIQEKPPVVTRPAEEVRPALATQASMMSSATPAATQAAVTAPAAAVRPTSKMPLILAVVAGVGVFLWMRRKK